MKVLYLTVPSFFDLEISLIRELSKVCDVTVLMVVSPASMHSSAFSVDALADRCEVIRATGFTGMEKYDSMIDRQRWYIANNPDNSLRSCLRLSRRIKKFLQENGFDLIHSTTDCKTSLFLLPFIKGFKNTLYTVHDPVPHNENSRIRKLLTRDILFRCYGNLLLLSNSLENEFRRTNEGKFKEIYHSGLSVYDFLKAFPVRENTYGRYVLFFGRIDQYKGVDLLVEAFKHTRAYQEGVRLVVAGKSAPGVGTLSSDDDKILILNRYIPNDELATLISHSLFVVLPYRSATQSGCVFSAYAFSKPVLATNVGDLPKQVDDSTGMVIKPDSVEDISKGIDTMLNCNLRKMSENISLRYAGDGERGWASIARGLFETYKTIKMQAGR